MHLRLFGRTRGRDLRDDDQSKNRTSTDAGPERRGVVPIGAAAGRLTASESEWPWWLSSPTTEAEPSVEADREASVARRWSLLQDELDDAASRLADGRARRSAARGEKGRRHDSDGDRDGCA